MSARTRLGPFGHGTRRTGAFGRAITPIQQIAILSVADALIIVIALVEARTSYATQADVLVTLLDAPNAKQEAQLALTDGMVTAVTLTEYRSG